MKYNCVENSRELCKGCCRESWDQLEDVRFWRMGTKGRPMSPAKAKTNHALQKEKLRRMGQSFSRTVSRASGGRLLDYANLEGKDLK